MRYVNEDIVLRGDEAKQFVYNLHHWDFSPRIWQ